MMRPWSRAAIVLFVCCAIATTGIVSADDMSEDDLTWTIMMYMAADSDPELPWQQDLNEMEEASIPEWMNVIALVDPLGYDNSFIIKMEHDENMSDSIVSPLVDDERSVIELYEVSMIFSQTLKDFIIFCQEEYPADRYVLVLWGHGAGWYGLCPDGENLLTLPALRSGITEAYEETGERLDLVVTESCSEGVFETMYELKGLTDLYVGSERIAWMPGYDYGDILDSLARDSFQPTTDLAKAFIRSYYLMSLAANYTATAALFNMGLVDEMADKIDAFADAAMPYTSIYRSLMRESVDRSEHTDFTEWYLDIGDLFRTFYRNPDLPPEVRFLALDVLSTYDDFVLEFAFNIGSEYYLEPQASNVTGAAIYLPYAAYYPDYTYLYLQYYWRTWDNLALEIRKNLEDVPMGEGPKMRIDDTDEDGLEDRLVITWPEDGEHSEAWVFVNTGEGLELVKIVESSSNELAIEGVGGDLMISSWYGHEDRAVSHSVSETRLYQQVTIDVSLKVDGTASDGSQVVTVTTSKGVVPMQWDDGLYTGVLTAPSDVTFGEVVRIQITDARTGAVVDITHAVFMGDDMSVVLDVGARETVDRSPLYVAAAVLVVASVAVGMVVARKKKSPP